MLPLSGRYLLLPGFISVRCFSFLFLYIYVYIFIYIYVYTYIIIRSLVLLVPVPLHPLLPLLLYLPFFISFLD